MKASNVSKPEMLRFFFFDTAQIITIETPYQVKEEEDNAMHSTVVIFSSNDNFTLKQVQFCCTRIWKTYLIPKFISTEDMYQFFLFLNNAVKE